MIYFDNYPVNLIVLISRCTRNSGTGMISNVGGGGGLQGMGVRSHEYGVHPRTRIRVDGRKSGGCKSGHF